MDQAYKKFSLTEKYVLSLPARAQKIINDVVMNWDSEELPENNEHFTRQVMRNSGLHVDESFWTYLQPNYGFELWTSSGKFLLGCKKFISLTSYDLNELRESNWHDLFHRPFFQTRQVEIAAMKMMVTQRPVLNVTPFHLVKEKKGQGVSINVRVKGLFPAWAEGDRLIPACIVSLVEFMPLDH